MSRAMDEYLHDASGRRLPQRERLARLNKRFADQSIKTEIPGGTFAERHQQRRAQDEMGHEIAAEVQRAADESKPAVNPFAARVADIERLMEYAPPQQRPGLATRLAMFRRRAAEWENDRAAAERKAAFDANPSIRLMREHAEALERGSQLTYPDVKRERIDLVLALAKSTAFEKPEDQAQKFWAAVYELDDQQRAAEAAKMQDATSKAQVASAEYQAQRQRLTEAEQRAAHAAKMAPIPTQNPSSDDAKAFRQALEGGSDAD